MKGKKKETPTGGYADVTFDSKWIENTSALVEASHDPSSHNLLSKEEIIFRQKVESVRTNLDLIDF